MSHLSIRRRASNKKKILRVAAFLIFSYLFYIMQLHWHELLSIDDSPVDEKKARDFLCSKRILITGAAGSIGSHLVERLREFRNSELILTDQSELGIFELSQVHSTARVVLGNLSDAAFASHLIKEIKPNIIFHTAAYKHVPLSEENIHVVTKNNIGSTLNLLEAAAKQQVKTFVHVSSDKATDPKGVMGLTKLISEKTVAAFRRQGFEYYYSVRFGNILGSSGSFSDTLVQKINSNLPVQVTNDAARRYFTAPNLVVGSLVLSLLSPVVSDVLIPKCHEEWGILELVEKIRGKLGKPTPPVQIVGLRSGEKLTETLTGELDEIISESSFFLFSLLKGNFDSQYLISVRSLIEKASTFSPELVEFLKP